MKKPSMTADHKWWVIWPLWLIACFISAAVIGVVVAIIAQSMGISLPMSTTLTLLLANTLIYALMLALLLSLPYAKKWLSWKLLGFGRLVKWSDIGYSVAGYVIYFIAAAVVINIVAKLVPGFNADQAQDIGFTSVYGLERAAAFIVLVVIAPIVEETIFRGFLFGKLRQHKMPLWPAILVVSVLFGLAHGQWNVGIGTFILSIIMCYLREMTGSIWAGVLVHMINNAVAFLLLFVIQLPR